MLWQSVALALTALIACAALAWSWRLADRLSFREHELGQLRKLTRRLEAPPTTLAAAPSPASPSSTSPVSPSPPPAGDPVLDALEAERSAFATIIAERVVPRRDHRAGEPFVLVVEVVLLNRGERDVRLSLRRCENETPLTVRRYLGQPDRLYSAPRAIAVQSEAEGEGSAGAQVVRAGGIETLDFAVPLHEAGLYRLAFRVEGDEIIPGDNGGGGASPIVWQRHKHVVVA